MSALCPAILKLTDRAEGENRQFKRRLADQKTRNPRRPIARAFAARCRLAVLDQRPFDVRVMGAAARTWAALDEGIEGRPDLCVARLPQCAGLATSVHIVTVSDCLAKRDGSGWGACCFSGLQVGVILAFHDTR